MADVVTFDPVSLLIVEIDTATPINTISAQEIYSEWKDWLLADPSRLGAPQAFTPIGGDPISETNNLGVTLFLENGWRIRPAEYSHKLIVQGNVYPREGGSIFVSTVGSFNVHTETVVSNLIEQTVVGGIDQATVQAAMTAQGYTTGRAPKIDNLDAALSSVAAAVWARVVDGTITAAESVRLMNAVLGGKVSGAGSGSERFRDLGDTKDRVTSTVDAQGNRTSVSRDLA
jgi:hypothetical protein